MLSLLRKVTGTGEETAEEVSASQSTAAGPPKIPRLNFSKLHAKPLQENKRRARSADEEEEPRVPPSPRLVEVGGIHASLKVSHKHTHTLRMRASAGPLKTSLRL